MRVYYNTTLVRVALCAILIFSVFSLFSFGHLPLNTPPEIDNSGSCDDAVEWMKKYSLIVLGDLNDLRESEGNIFVGGDINISGTFNVGLHLNNSNFGSDISRKSLEVAGDIVAGNNININKYSAALSTTVTQNGAVQWFIQDKSGGNRMVGVNDGNSGASLVQDMTLTAKAAEIEADMLYATEELCKASSTLNATLNATTQNAFLNISDMNSAVVNLTALEASDFFNATTSFTINTPNNTQYDKPIIINIKGVSYNVPNTFNMGNIQNQLHDNIIWNFCEATTVNIPSVVKGSLLAPIADVTLGNNIDGVLVGKNISIGSESHLPFLGVDFSDFCGSELVGIGGTVFEDVGGSGAIENDGIQGEAEMGVSGVILELYRDVNEDLMITGSETTSIATTTTNSDGTYLFECLQAGKYQVRIPTSNFTAALSGLPSSSIPTNEMNDDDTDNDDNGMQLALMAEVISPIYMLMVDNEPNNNQEPLTPEQDGFNNSPRDKNTNTTVDFGFQTVPLPVELLSFKASVKKNYVMLKWLTASEIENEHFELERSEDSKIFKSIAWIEGNGTNLDLSEYSYEDYKVVAGNTYYYRLKQVDFDGSVAYSEIQTVVLDVIDEQLSVYPNPIGGGEILKVRLFSTKAQIELKIKDVMNKTIRSYVIDVNLDKEQIFELFIDELSSGIYFLQTSEGEAIQFVKE